MAARKSTGRSRSGASRSRRKSAPARGARRKAARSRSTSRSRSTTSRTRRASSRGRSSGGRKYGPKAQQKVEKVMRERKRGTLRSGGSGRKVTSRKQAIAIGLSEARRAGAKVPSRRGASRKK